ncbi:phosphoribosyltransferase [Amycolatopsis acidiphila]|uniref:Phosphoribosyltransferase n=1 Tax=Amycolatopsis acidiphila TaxID=715473 RepID=A0A558AN44_9PSEU|nr:phosphoribosyltransferase family protein [Amycolatopsis acidiphila]TVT25687.1 phosphoribosyltransferase [Amycolatopsis acidiphila]UIJ60444.1 phosphoribosyltransferase [Amycolatopsis acidiphila]GHG82859.1 phosphoribosyltransferase [Amycolatopsis acidiphila]
MTRTRAFPDRRAAGLRLGAELRRREWHDPLVLGLARGGVVVAHAVAETLDAPLDVAVARKIGAPGHPEFGVGAVTATGDATFDARTLHALRLRPEDLREARESEQAEARRREQVYLRGRDPESRTGRDIILVDDGLATGVTARAAAHAIRGDQPRSLAFAAPVCAPEAAAGLKADVDEVVCLLAPDDLRAIGEWYVDFAQTSDEEVVDLLGSGPA